MQHTKVILAPEVDAAILRLIDYVHPSEIPAVLDFLEALQHRLVHTLISAPLAGRLFQGKVRFLSLSGYTYLYEYDPDRAEVYVLDLMMPGQDWR